MKKLSRELLLKALKNRNNPRLLLSREDLGNTDKLNIPNIWWDMASFELPQIEAFKTLWQPMFTQIPMITHLIELKLLGMAILLEDGFEPSLIYLFARDGGHLSFFRGFSPIQVETLSDDMRSIWKHLPKYFTDFYLQVHNGWHSLFAEAGGPDPIHIWFRLDRREWDIDEHTIKKMGFAPERMLLVYTNGGSEYLGFVLPEVSQHQSAEPVRWSTKSPSKPKFVQSFWQTYDEMELNNFEELTFPNSE